MPLQKRRMLEWGITRARALRRGRVVWRGSRVRWQPSGRVDLETFELLGPGPGEVLVRTRISAISPGTERALYNRLPNTRLDYPYTPGYSGVGRVLAVGGVIPGLRLGDSVAGPLPHASLAVLPAERLFALPDPVDEADAAFLHLGIIALQGVRKAGIRWGDRVAVLGRGVLGLLVTRIAGLASAAKVVIAGRSPSRASAGGSTIENLLAGSGRFDIVLDVTGNPEAVADAARILAPGGRIVVIGSPRGSAPPLPVTKPPSEPLEIRGAHVLMLPRSEASPGRWTYRQEGLLFLDWLSRDGLKPFESPAERLNPREAWRFYRRLGREEVPVGAALFDWRLVPRGERSRSSTFLPPRGVWIRDPEAESKSAIRRRVERAPRPGASKGRAMGGKSAVQGRKLGFAMVGCGEVAVRNARAVTESGAAVVRWAVDPSLDLARDLAERCGATAATTLQPVLEDPGVDAVFVCAPHHLHAPLCLEAIGAKRHVLVEKPIARNATEAGAIAEAARSAGVKVATCYPMRFLPHVLAARRLVEEGGMGRIQGAKIAEHIYKEMPYWYGGITGRSRSSWRAHKATSGGGVLLTNLCHHLDALLFVTGGAVRRIYCDLGRFDAPGDVEDLVVLSLRLDGGAIVSVDASTCAPGGGASLFQIWGADGQIALDPPPRFLSLKETTLGRPNAWTALPRGEEAAARREFVRAFAAAILGEGSLPAPLEESIAVQTVIDSAYDSAERGEPVEIPLRSGPRSVDVVSHG